MCGIVGCVGEGALDVVLSGLAALEHRGYDSVGVASVGNDIIVEKDAVRIERFLKKLNRKSLSSSVVVGHTRWATHGVPNATNAHPHTDCSSTLAVVHNGIIENHADLRRRLIEGGHRIISETDTELIAHLIEENYEGDLLKAVRMAVRQLEGAYAICVVAKDKNEIVLARMMSPLCIGVGEGRMFAASEPVALLKQTKRFVFLEDGDCALINNKTFIIVDAESGKTVNRPETLVDWTPQETEKSGYPHFMLKEIYEQPEALEKTVGAIVDGGTLRLRQEEEINSLFKNCRRVALVACGTAFHACMVASYMLREFCKFDVWTDVGSEFRYSPPPLDEQTVVIAVSQSGETADTLAPVRHAKKHSAKILAVCNVATSSLVREADLTLLTHAGPEIGVASTKAYTTQLAVLTAVIAHLSKRFGNNPKDLLLELFRIPTKARLSLQSHKLAKKLASDIASAPSALYIGRRYNLPTAYEGALKLKEISYIHAEGYGAGEMKHGPIALVQPDWPVVAICPKDSVREKMLSNMQETLSRGGPIYAVATEGDSAPAELAKATFFIPHTLEPLTPILAVIPLQLLAYEVAILRGCDVDKPRNLAKSVTVE